jgi:hypothetical protein
MLGWVWSHHLSDARDLEFRLAAFCVNCGHMHSKFYWAPSEGMWAHQDLARPALSRFLVASCGQEATMGAYGMYV